jgi:hypothetical protein
MVIIGWSPSTQLEIKNYNSNNESRSSKLFRIHENS